MRAVIGEDLTDEDVEHIVNYIDKDGDGKISYPEFLEAFQV